MVQLVLAVQPGAPLKGVRTLTSVIALSGLWAIWRSMPRYSAERQFKQSAFSVVVRVGDLFAERADLVVGFTDTFDTSIERGDIVSPRSVQGQLLSKVFRGDVATLDSSLLASLRDAPTVAVESESSKPRGKRARYPIGAVAAIAHEGRRYYCVAYSRLGNDLVAKSSVDYLWRGLGNLWTAVAAHGHLDPVAIPIIGSDLAKVSSLGREGLLKMILLSFVAESRVNLISRQLTVVIAPGDADDVNMLEVQAFLDTL
ncbi:macro domain-containing protein [Streptomyces coelicoflavus]|uniref:macro domain-containing protein n=1 Tax=Streptomyces coelicoflavus TaxID=285562 RepID=UPI003699B18C